MAGAVAPPDRPRRKKLYREASPGERWWFALLLVPAVLTALVVHTQGHAIEATLERDTRAALEAAGLTGTTVEVHGRNVTVSVPTGQSQDTAQLVAESVAGIGSVDVAHVARNAAEARACDDLQAKLDETASGRGFAFEGSSTSLSRSSVAAVNAIAKLLVRCPSARVVANGYTDGSVLKGSTVSLRRAEAVRDALVRGGVQSGRVGARGFGDAFPASVEDTAAGRRANNRVTVTLVED